MHASSPLPLDRLFVQQARRTPERPALLMNDRVLTYAQLDARSTSAAVALRARAIGAGAVVGLHLERSLDWVAAVFAILRTGAAVMPLPPSYPPARLRDILAHAGLAAVIHDRATPLDPALHPSPLDFDGLRGEARGRLPDAADEADPDADRPAFVLCSSGSTGTPKMIVRSHRSFLHRLGWTWTQHPFLDGEVGCHKAHVTTTHGIYELFEPLLAGAPTLIVPDPQVRDLEQFWALVRERGVTRLLIVPSALQASLDLPGFAPPPLRVVVLMGEHLPEALALRAAAAFPEPTRLYSIYGSTEASSTLVCDLHASARPDAPLPLGYPITPDVGAHVLDGNLDPVAPGASGRLYIAGRALFDGYLGNPEMTAKVVVRHPRTGERLYDTRDDVRRLADGNILFAGRADDTVKVRGFRVELAEVERAMAACTAVTQTAVVVTGGDGPDAALAGFYTPRSVPPRDVYQALREHLPPYMIPSTLIGLDAFPLTERSKLDRKRLIAECLPREQAEPATRPLSASERRVAAAWERTLGHRRFDPDTSFFEAGGTSLTTAALMQRLRYEFVLDRERLPELFAYRFPTVEAMARHLDGADDLHTAGTAGQSPVLVTLRRAAHAGKPPLFCVASAGGTVGAYQKVAAALRYEGEIIGVRDPYVSGERDPTEDFGVWVGRYLDAMTSRQPEGPYCILAYSSAGAFGYEIARLLRQRGAEVALLALVDPLGIEGDHRRRYGWWVWRSTHDRAWVRTATRLAGALRRPTAALLRWRATRRQGQGFAMSQAEFDQLARDTATARGHLMALAALMELNTGLPIDLSDTEIPPEPADSTLQALKARVAEVMPGVDGETIERIATQYTLQARAQRAYRLAPFDSPTLLVEPVTPYAGIVELQLRSYVAQMEAVRLALGTADARAQAIARRFGTLAPHFLSMRDDRFATGLAEALDRRLEAADLRRRP